MAVKIGTMTLPGSPVDGANPLPRFRRETGFGLFSTKGEFPPEALENLGAQTRTLPYLMQDRYSRERKPVTLKTIVMENDFLRATFVPEYGGKLWSLYDKTLDRELLMANPVLQPGNLAIRNAWTSGGIEWNFGSLGHTYFTCDNVFAAILRDGDGSDFLRIYEFERAKECVWQADFHLPDGSSQLYSHIRITNPGETDKTTYWWTNIAIPEDGGTRILSSSRDVIVVCGGEGITYERLPYLSVMPGDLSYPINATRSFDYFFQPDPGVSTTWEGGVNKNGFTFYDRSTAPLLYHKMFCWGNHRGGARWQEYLSDGNRGSYIEIQAGIAQSQLHDKPFPAGAVFEWTQCYGGTKLDPDKIHGRPLEEADAELGAKVDTLIPEEKLLEMHRKFCISADKKIRESNLVHVGSGWGALENMRKIKAGLRKIPENTLFPESTLGPEQKTWLELLEIGRICAPDPRSVPISWMVSDEWRDLTGKSLSGADGRNWFSLLHYGNMLFEHWDDTVVAAKAAKWPDEEKNKFEKMAEDAWKESDRLLPNVWARRNLALLEKLRGNTGKYIEYYDSVFELDASISDFCFAAEYMGWLNADKEYEKAMKLYEKLPAGIQKADRIRLHMATCAVKLGMTDMAEDVFNEEHHAIREGENSLTDLWFEYNALKLAAERGIDPASMKTGVPDELMAEAEARFPPPHQIDFRMSYDKKYQYRATE